jgi:hypothetical protein
MAIENLFKIGFCRGPEVIEQAIHFVLSGEIVQFRYDAARQQIVARE